MVPCCRSIWRRGTDRAIDILTAPLSDPHHRSRTRHGRKGRRKPAGRRWRSGCGLQHLAASPGMCRGLLLRSEVAIGGGPADLDGAVRRFCGETCRREVDAASAQQDATKPGVYEVASGPITGMVVDEAIIRAAICLCHRPWNASVRSRLRYSRRTRVEVGPSTFQVQGPRGVRSI